MGIVRIIGEEVNEVPSYPYVGVFYKDNNSESFSVLFTGKERGFVVSVRDLTKHWNTGDYRSDWDEKLFTPVKRTVLFDTK